MAAIILALLAQQFYAPFAPAAVAPAYAVSPALMKMLKIQNGFQSDPLRTGDCQYDPVESQASNSPDISGVNYLHTCRNLIFDHNGREFTFVGVNWFGLETSAFAPDGLLTRKLDDILDEIAQKGYNAIRLPFSSEAIGEIDHPRAINYDLNPDLQGLSTLEIMDKIVEGARKRGLRIVLDRHRPTSWSQTPLWYTDSVSEKRWIDDWRMLAQRYLGNDTVVAFDLHNEPHDGATWGTDNVYTDWRLAAERAGNAILEVNPYLLIFVQGIETYQQDSFWWGAQLRAAGEFPVRLNIPNRLVYSTHDYGPEVYDQKYFHDPTFPANLESVWDLHWGYLQKQEIAPVVMGEFDGPSLGDDISGKWQKTLLRYLFLNRIGFFVWNLDKQVWDRRGNLTTHWATFALKTQNLAKGYLFPPGLREIIDDLITRTRGNNLITHTKGIEMIR